MPFHINLQRNGRSNMARQHSVSVRLSSDEYEWLRRKAHWDGSSLAEIFRRHLQNLIAEEGYLRPPDDDPQDFGYEKEMIQFVLSVQNAREEGDL
jgi:hypothetical protein